MIREFHWLVGLPADNVFPLPIFETVLRGIKVVGSLVGTREDLAEQAVDDLAEIPNLDPQRAGELILAARKHWFEQSQQA